MALYFISKQSGTKSELLTSALKFAVPQDFLPTDTGWLVSWKGTARELSDVLKITDGTHGSALILEVASYYGRANPEIWSWILSRWGK